MARQVGTRNADYAEARRRLAKAVREHLLRPGGARASFRELAEAAGVSTATLRHYFVNREGVLAGVLEAIAMEAAPHILQASTEGLDGGVQASLSHLVRSTMEAWRRHGVGPIHALGLTAGLGDSALGPRYVTHLLEPTLQLAEGRLARHVARQELPPLDVRHAALALMSPVILALLHQHELGGSACRPLDLDAFVKEHLARFLAAWNPPAARPPSARPDGSGESGTRRT